MGVDPIPREELEPFAEPGRNVEKHDQRRYAALHNEIGGDPMIEDMVADADDALWRSRRPQRAANTIYAAMVPAGAGSHFPIKQAAMDYYDVASLAGEENPAVPVALMAPFAVGTFVGMYGKVQSNRASEAVADLADAMHEFTDYRVVSPYEVGRFEHVDAIEDLLQDAGTVRAEPRIEELYIDDEDHWVDDNQAAVEMYHDVLAELEAVHTGGVADETADGVNLYGSGFLEPFFGAGEAVQRAAEIESSGVAQLLRTAETTTNLDGDNPVLTSEYVFRLELVYNGQTVAKFDGTCDEPATELGEQLLDPDDIPQGGQNSGPSFSSVLSTYQDLGAELGMTFDEDDYEIGFFGRGGIPRHLYDTAETMARDAYGTGKAFYGAGKAVLRSLDVRGATR